MSSFASASTLSSRLAHECCFLKCVLKFHKGDYTLKKKSCHNLPLTCEAEEGVGVNFSLAALVFRPRSSSSLSQRRIRGPQASGDGSFFIEANVQPFSSMKKVEYVTLNYVSQYKGNFLL